MRQTGDVLNDAKQEGALVMASACPLSHFNLDTYQVKAGKASGKDVRMPVIHLPELVAYSFGYMADRYAYLENKSNGSSGLKLFEYSRAFVSGQLVIDSNSSTVVPTRP